MSKDMKVSERLLQKALPIWESYYEHPFYGNWIGTYTSKGFRDCNDDMIAMCDRFSEGYSEEQIRNLERIVELCSYYEYQFWDMAWNEGYEYKAPLK